MGRVVITEIEKIMKEKRLQVLEVKRLLKDLMKISENQQDFFKLMEKVKSCFTNIDILDEQANKLLNSLNTQNSQQLKDILLTSFSENMAENISSISVKLHQELDTIMKLDKILAKELIDLNNQYDQALNLASSYQPDLSNATKKSSKN